ncbi:GNAT family N-acetyltransferase [Massilia sp. DJPM01]|uniref:GNAT family N-acetyltransferase n=1 Tax=Massilia sp. DJPM01 TaxID=3024404 RepID=UPI00259FBE5E|nr:GNAT family N-acetyltransferase [Massilia sp. DJPM01]MDM5180946.1 GNAT family N-acetyltransferase [Massilia sp. DJPM01]
MFTIRPARMSEKAQLEALIARSGIGLADGFYTPQEAAAVTREVFGVDSALVEDGTYFAVEEGATVVACGGWSRRATDFGGDGAKHGNDRLLDPATEPARIRAFFVEPAMARRGLGSLLLRHCMEAAAQAGFGSLELVSTMPGEPLYRAHGFAPIEPIALPLPAGVVIRLTRMGRSL